LSRELSQPKRQNLISYAVLFVSLAIAFLPILSLIFPALIVSFTTQFPDETVDPFEFGVLFLPFLVTNLILLGIFILYHRKKLPTLIEKSIKFIFNFEVSKRVSLLVILALLAIYVAFSFHELLEPEQWPDFNNILCVMDGWPFENICENKAFFFFLYHKIFFTILN